MRNRWLRWVWAASFSLSAAAAENVASLDSGDLFPPVHFTSQDHLLLLNKQNPSDLEATASQQFLHENRMGLESGPFRLGIHFSNRFLLNQSTATSLTDKPFTLEKKSLTGEWDQWEVRLGDSYQELGKGIALSLYQDDIFGINNTLEGGSVKFHSRGLEALGFAGRVNAITSPVAVYALENPVKDRTVWLFGASVGGRPLADTKVSAHYLLALNQPNHYEGYDKTWTTVGATVQRSEPEDAVEAYGEVNALFRHINVSGDDREMPRGWGAYTALSWAPSPLKVKWETKLYEQFDFEFRRPPTLEEDVVETINTQNVAATKWLADYRLADGAVTVGASYLWGYDKVTSAPIHHWVSNGKWKISSRVEVEGKGGYRTSPERHWMAHASLKTKVRTFKGQFAEVGLRKQYSRIKLDLLPTTEDRNAVDLSYVFSERVSSNLGYEYLPENDAASGQHFANLGATVHFGALSAKGLIGRTSGGTLCSGGVCRQVPAYSGALVETTYTF